MNHGIWKYGVVAAAALAFAACGDDPATTSNNGANNGMNNGTNNGANNGMNNGTNNGANNGTNNGVNNGANNGTTVEAPPSCSDATPPARCAEDASAFAWAPASIVDKFVIEGNGAEDPVCCFDFTGDGEIDNQLGNLLNDFSFKADINSNIQTSIESGSLALVLEHDGLTDIADGQTFTANFWLADWGTNMTAIAADGGNEVTIDPASIDAGAQPKAYVPGGKIAGTDFSAGPGQVVITVDILSTPLTLVISQARIEAVVDAAASGVPDKGVALTSGKLGGVVRVSDIYKGLNAFTSSCACLGLNGEDLITGIEENAPMCNANAMAAACTADADSTCKSIGENCSLLSLLGSFADVDTDGDTEPDAISVGATLTTKGAKIVGITP